MRGFDPASEDDMDDNGMSRYVENTDDEGCDWSIKDVECGLFILGLFVIIIAASIMPWWFLPVTIAYFIIVELFRKHWL